MTRCLALADMLAEYFQCIFLVQNPAESVMAQIKENHALVCLAETADYLAEAKGLSKKYFSKGVIVVLDGYEFRTEYQRIVRSSGIKLVCIDDLHTWHFVADAVINQAGEVVESDYSCEIDTRLCLGPAYALLREPFLQAARQRQRPKRNGGLFVCFGGADPEHLTQRTVRLAAKSGQFRKIVAVVGSAAANEEALVSLQREVPALELHSNADADTMVSLMRRCELAIAPASGISYEIASVGLRFITGYYVDNQKYLYRFLTENGLAQGADQFQEENLHQLLSGRAEADSGQLERQEKWFAGKSSRHLRGVFIRLALWVRKAVTGDTETYFAWANEPETRRNSLDPNPIAWPQHQAWYTRHINDPNFVFYLFCVDEVPVGQVRFELVEDTATISYSVDEQFRGMGLGFEMISQALKKLAGERGMSLVKGVVKNDNPASLATFRKIGFRIVAQGDRITNFAIAL